ncbi:tyrosine-type recombinase/integrase [Tautonia plasticadhaerens]|uniref:Core-binding (CB) domain-containing protein n=1 Tax=Tautonia plasticadhaerens TaxID=2527974 RepID=A0A518H3D1_9BACT|nr:phage integrase family protein [Tautonia plasticadhaerens]QDV35356.1 hypothetical protein ElP_32590 [Tautonia plasticadhaerens]
MAGGAASRVADRCLPRHGARPGWRPEHSAGGYANTQGRLKHFRQWIGERTPIDSINADRWESYWRYLIGKKWSSEYKKSIHRSARTFLDWLVGKGVIDPLPNLNDRRHRFQDNRPDDEADIDPMPIDDFRRLIEHTKDTPTELYLLLMANCGFYPQDIADLKPGEVRWDAGRIVRRRSKTKREKRPPRVDYPLWPRTLELLGRFRSSSPEHVLLSSKGTVLVDRWMDGNKTKKKDNVALAIKRTRDLIGVSHPPKAIRKRSATLIRSNPHYADLRFHFLGHAPPTIADEHYSAIDQGRFDVCVTWLAECYGIK